MYSKQRNVHDFISALTGADSAETQGYLSEIVANKKFDNSVESNKKNYGGKWSSDLGWSIGTTLGTVLYSLCRKIRPDIVVETGVASGVSSSYILCSLEENKNGVLYSIDLSWQEGQSGWLIPDYLQHRWHLITGRSSDKLPPLLDNLNTIDIFLHDSEHTYRNMLFEYQAAWIHLRHGGLLLSHNIDASDAFPDFCESVRLQGYTLDIFGGLLKD